MRAGIFVFLSCICTISTATTAHAQQHDSLQRQQQPLSLQTVDKTTDSVSQSERVFTLRSIHHRGTHEFPSLHVMMEVPQSAGPGSDMNLSREEGPVRRTESSSRPFAIKQRLISVTASKDVDEGVVDSTVDDVVMKAPDVTDKQTVINFAKMAADAYIWMPGTGEWKDVNETNLNASLPFGWDSDGIRGHVFADEDNTTVVIGIKGTSFSRYLDLNFGNPHENKQDMKTTPPNTVPRDLLNDNLLASCCCGQGGQYFWHQVCSCASPSAGLPYTCNSSCLATELSERDRYYGAAIDMYHSISLAFPNATDIWLTGHSLGGVVASLLGHTFGLPTLTFEAFPDALAASRLGLFVPPNQGNFSSSPGTRRTRGSSASPPTYHFGNTADPVFMGSCNAWNSACTLGGYAMQSQCHTGRRCVYDTVSDLGWRVSIENHRILNVIDYVLEQYQKVPECVVDEECVDCYEWNFVL
ncbi:hypothetical protein AAFC00_000847 [Neodothiora populina]|uniref:triacylglycerol lipase n=1 Tax=Neodothiora populina TaxID=2781224 RepID=A0ABR3PM79_9PEZI